MNEPIEKEAFAVTGTIAALWFAFNALMAADSAIRVVKHGYKGFKSLGQGDFRDALGHAGRAALNSAFVGLDIAGMGSGIRGGGKALRLAGGGSKLLKARKANAAAKLGNGGFWKAWRLRNRGVMGGVGRGLAGAETKLQGVRPLTQQAYTALSQGRPAFQARPAWADQAWQTRWGNKLRQTSNKVRQLPGVNHLNRLERKYPKRLLAGQAGATVGWEYAFPEKPEVPDIQDGLPNNTQRETPSAGNAGVGGSIDFDRKTYRPYGYNQRNTYQQGGRYNQRPNNMYKQSSEMSVLLAASKRGLVSPQQKQLLAALNRLKEV